MEISSNVVLTEEHLHETVDYFSQHEAYVFDVESVGKYRGIPTQNQVTWMGMATHGKSVAIPMGHPNGNRMLTPATRRKVSGKFVQIPATYDEPPVQLRPSQVFSALSPLFFSPDHRKVAHNAPFDFVSVAKYFGNRLPVGPYDDTIVMAWLCNENRRLGLKDLTQAEYRRKYDTKNTGRQVEIHPFNEVARYVYLDATYTWLHYLNLLEKMKQENVESIYYNIEAPLLGPLFRMGMVGINVDEPTMQETDVRLSKELAECEGKIYKAAGYKFNVRSNPQKVKAFYGPKEEGGQGLKPWKLTKGGMDKQEIGQEITLDDYSTDKDSLERWPTNKLVRSFLDYQEISRVLGTYIKGYLGDPEDPKKPTQIFDGCVYPNFVQYGTVTGRFSCREPNLQNIPRPNTDLGRVVRGLFIPPSPEHSLIVADYGQIELVVLAHYVKEGALYDGFYRGVDPHTITASLVFDVGVEDVTKDMRQIAKNINFAVVYGAGEDKVALMSGTTVTKAKAFLAKHKREFPEIYAFKDQVIRTCREREYPYIKTLMGRKRRIPAIYASDYKVRGKAERQAVNSLIQGSSADLIKLAMLRLDDVLYASGKGRLHLTVHDELVSSSLTKDCEEVSGMVREAMLGEGIQKWVDVPLTIDLKVVNKWSEAK